MDYSMLLPIVEKLLSPLLSKLTGNADATLSPAGLSMIAGSLNDEDGKLAMMIGLAFLAGRKSK